jgi:hypothetical protein
MAREMPLPNWRNSAQHAAWKTAARITLAAARILPSGI